PAVCRGHEHELASAPLDHMGNDSTGNEESPLQIGVEGPVPQLFIGFKKRNTTDNTRDIHQNVDTIIPAHHASYHPVYLLPSAYVAGNSTRLPSALLNVFRCRGHHLAINIGYHDASPLLGHP